MDSKQHTWGKSVNVTLNDVAKAAGVSQSAASVVLNGAKSGTGVSADRRRKVIEAAERLGYRPNALARSLITGRTNLIGVYSGRSRLDSRNSFYAELLGGCFEGSAEFGSNVVVHTNGNGPGELLNLVSNGLLDGLIVHADNSDPILGLLGEFRVPAVAVADVVEGLPSVLVDDMAGGTLQAHHLASLGHKRVLVKKAPSGSNSTVRRMEAFIKVANSLGIHVFEKFETFEENDGLDVHDIELLRCGPDRATAVVGWSDDVAQRICNKLDSLGVGIPSDVAVVGFDGFNHGIKPRFRLTSIKAPWSSVGRTAARLLMTLYQNESVPAITTLPVEFIRGSTT